MASISIENVDKIISYLNPIERIRLNSKYREETIRESKEKIRKVVTKWLLSYSVEMDNNYYHVPKIVYKKFYPLKYRKSFIEKALDITAGNIKHWFICTILNEHNSLVGQFNNIVDILSEDELFNIGW